MRAMWEGESGSQGMRWTSGDVMESILLLLWFL